MGFGKMRSIYAVIGAAVCIAVLSGCAVKDAAELYQEQHASELDAERAARRAETQQIADLTLHRVDPRSITPVNPHVAWLQHQIIDNDEAIAAIRARDSANVDVIGRSVKGAFATAKLCSLAGSLEIGMTEQQVVDLCRYGDVTETQTADHSYKQAAHHWANGARAYFYFTDGRLTSVQTSDSPY
jgi:hypothetical protein